MDEELHNLPDTAVVAEPARGQVREADREIHNAAHVNGHRPPLFWQGAPAQDTIWHIPPTPLDPDREREHQRNLKMLDDLSSLLKDNPFRAWEVRWRYLTRTAAAAAEHYDVEYEARKQLEELRVQAKAETTHLTDRVNKLRAEYQSMEEQLAQARTKLARSVASAGLSIEPEEAAKGEQTTHLDEENVIETISPILVEDALQNSVPKLDEMAGREGVLPIHKPDFMSSLLRSVMQFIAPAVAGLLLAVSLGTLIGLIDLDTLLRSDGLPRIVLSAGLGFVIVYLMGEVFHTAVSMLARNLESRHSEGEGRAVPRIRAGMGLAIAFASIALLLGLAEVTAEGMGLRMLHQQQILRQMRFQAPNTPPPAELPLPLYMLIGTLISGPYLLFKCVSGWNENESQMRQGWLLHRQSVWLEEKRKEPDVQETFHLAHVVQHLENNLRRIKRELKHAEQERSEMSHPTLPPQVQARLDASRAAAVGEATGFQKLVEDLLHAKEPLPQPPQTKPAAVKPARAGWKR